MAHAQKPDFVFRRNGRVHLNRHGASVQSTTGSRGVRISGSNAGYTTFRGSVKSTGYPLHSPVSPSLPLPCVTVCHHISTGLYLRMGPQGGLDAVEGRKILCPPPGIEFQFLSCPTRSNFIHWFMTIAHRCVKPTSVRSWILIQQKIFIIIIIIIIIISNLSNDRSKASSKTIPPHSAI